MARQRIFTVVVRPLRLQDRQWLLPFSKLKKGWLRAGAHALLQAAGIDEACS
ncbi:hypothetical protein [Nitritalea halalkaliphila]|uniref:hypothetical protein n=1 Tax=Nitritalea halalkaliphila TaxID=590849 RepID=UPI0012EADF52|nr:hypothetical protein [Nitritalea halalkaliphila]